MPSFAAVSRTRHAMQRWRRYDNYLFASQSAVAPLVSAELPRAVMAFPIAFAAENNRFMPVAILSLEPQRNLFVAPDGRWTGAYVPSVFRAHPFRLISRETGDIVLCVDEASGLVGEEGEPFFDETGSISKPTKMVLDFLSTVEASREATVGACAALAGVEVIRPWEITLKTGAGERKLEGLLKIDEAALNALPADDFEALRKAGALPLAYCQMLSMQHLAGLCKLAEARAAHRREADQIIKQSFVEADQGEIDIDWNLFAGDEDND